MAAEMPKIDPNRPPNYTPDPHCAEIVFSEMLKRGLALVAIVAFCVWALSALPAQAAVSIRAEFTSTQRGQSGYLRLLCTSDVDLSGFTIPMRFMDSVVKIDSVVLAPQMDQSGFYALSQISAARDRALTRILPEAVSPVPTIRPNDEELFRIHYKVEPTAPLGLVIADTFVVRYQLGEQIWWDRLEVSNDLGLLVLSTFDYGGVTVTLGPPTDAEDEPFSPLPADFDLGQNYPNPFNPVTTIPVHLPRAATISLEIFDVSGRPVREPMIMQGGAGTTLVQVALGDFPSGVYMYRIRTPFGEQSRKMILLK